MVSGGGGGVVCRASLSSFTHNKGGGGAPSLDPPLYAYFIATPYKGFQSQDYIPIILK